ncbi:hypothetical protein LSH36_1115g00017 [Paralvinella palmiformis]|uniref:Secreted protein n=1 Tax=Paralvinella palmiformis TaxID=53620 RepID=A0AAD9MRN7_9ANNE|nr:hypothetical protein LSH36_1115g00017 [Paralvinella palmiformis]
MKIPSITLFVLVCVTWVGGEARMSIPFFGGNQGGGNQETNGKEVDCSEIDVTTATLITADSCPPAGGGVVYFKYFSPEAGEYLKCAKLCPYTPNDQRPQVPPPMRIGCNVLRFNKAN